MTSMITHTKANVIGACVTASGDLWLITGVQREIRSLLSRALELHTAERALLHPARALVWIN